MADVTLTYQGATIAELDDSGSKTIRTAGKFCVADIGLEYVKPSGGEGTCFGSVEQMTVATECNWYAIWQAFQYKLKYKKSSVLMVCVSPDVAQTGSNYTNFAYTIAHNGTTVISPKENRWYYQQKAQKVPPNSIAFRFDRYSADWYYANAATINADGGITNPVAENNTVMVPAGACIYLFEFPRDYQNGEIDMTPFGG